MLVLVVKRICGPITAAVGINIDGTLKGVRVLEQNETPGLVIRSQIIRFYLNLKV